MMARQSNDKGFSKLGSSEMVTVDGFDDLRVDDFDDSMEDINNLDSYLDDDDDNNDNDHNIDDDDDDLEETTITFDENRHQRSSIMEGTFEDNYYDDVSNYSRKNPTTNVEMTSLSRFASSQTSNNNSSQRSSIMEEAYEEDLHDFDFYYDEILKDQSKRICTLTRCLICIFLIVITTVISKHTLQSKHHHHPNNNTNTTITNTTTTSTTTTTTITTTTTATTAPITSPIDSNPTIETSNESSTSGDQPDDGTITTTSVPIVNQASTVPPTKASTTIDPTKAPTKAPTTPPTAPPAPVAAPTPPTEDSTNNDNNDNSTEGKSHVPKKTVQPRDGFPSYLQYQDSTKIDVAYDERAITINGERVLLLGGSIHPIRTSKERWIHAMSEAVDNGLNLITIPVFWHNHQKFPDDTISWSFGETQPIHNDEDGDWNLAMAISIAAQHGLFVHIRLGPYVCAEYTYGGIPEWLPLITPDMEMRRYNTEWMKAMESFVHTIIEYLTDNTLWAHQGGPIIMGQIENEVGGDTKDEDKEIQKYADWCGDLVRRLAPDVSVWTMSHGLSATNTILTCNGHDRTCLDFLEADGGPNRRIQKEQPGMITEYHSGFQTWGESPRHPSRKNYFWGVTAATMTKDMIRWFARGGTHFNYYVWYGGYNYGRMAAAGFTNMYGSDAILCPSGERRQPKFTHTQNLHTVLADVAYVIVNSPSANLQDKRLDYSDPNTDQWNKADQNLFVYVYTINNDNDNNDNDDNNNQKSDYKKVAFVENYSKNDRYFRLSDVYDNNDNTNDGKDNEDGKIIIIHGESSLILVDDAVRFESTDFDPKAMAVTRKTLENFEKLKNWQTWQEPIGINDDDDDDNFDYNSDGDNHRPKEQTMLNMDAGIWSDYAWYQQVFTLDDGETYLNDRASPHITLETETSNAFSIFIDNILVGTSANHVLHPEGEDISFIELDKDIVEPIFSSSNNVHTLSILSESLGYGNFIGRFDSTTAPKKKGISGTVKLVSADGRKEIDFVNNDHSWKSYPGLHGELYGLPIGGFNEIPNQSEIIKISDEESKNNNKPISDIPSPSWWSVSFETPIYYPNVQALFLENTLGRGHIWLNGRDLGRYWDITRDEVEYHNENLDHYTQRYYFIPHDFLYKVDDPNSGVNQLIMFDATGNHDFTKSARLVLSWIEDSEHGEKVKDEVSYPMTCLE